ncbi:MAG: hypothetical protein ABSG50_04130 [Opitutaceae bacterium]|jgi:hypothetical protein
MKTLLSLLSIFVLLMAAVSLDASYQLDAGVIFSVVAVAALFAIALNDSRRPERFLVPTRVERFPEPSRCSVMPRANSMDLAA